MYLTLLIYIGDDFVHFTSVDDIVLDDFVLLTHADINLNVIVHCIL